MIQTFIISAILLVIGVIILGFRIFFIKNGEFPNIHIGGNQGLKRQGVHCATTQDQEAQAESKRVTNKDLMKEIIEKL
ncbi:MAG: hypothetical protein AB7E26_14125 [Chryseobacterium sp.]